jgi:hypothetical protein
VCAPTRAVRVVGVVVSSLSAGKPLGLVRTIVVHLHSINKHNASSQDKNTSTRHEGHDHIRHMHVCVATFHDKFLTLETLVHKCRTVC